MGVSRFGVVSILGRPNAGKSTLLNRLLGQELSIVTHKPQTTRFTLTGVMTHGSTQMVIMDTPGLFACPRNELDKFMLNCAKTSSASADHIILLIDMSRPGLGGSMGRVINGLREHRSVHVLGNKADLSTPDSVKEAQAQVEALLPNVPFFAVCAKSGLGVKGYLSYLAPLMPEGEWRYGEEDYTTAPVRLLAADITRKQALLHLLREVPYQLNVETEHWQQLKGGERPLVRIHQIITVPKESHKPILIGEHGKMLQQIRQAASKEIAKVLSLRPVLHLFVRVKKDWAQGFKPDCQLGV